MYDIKASGEDYWASHKEKEFVHPQYPNSRQNNASQGQKEADILSQSYFTGLALALPT